MKKKKITLLALPLFAAALFGAVSMASPLSVKAAQTPAGTTHHDETQYCQNGHKNCDGNCLHTTEAQNNREVHHNMNHGGTHQNHLYGHHGGRH